ncbi:hypothetical protein [Actinoplanes xinjiangensis]|nr:hypothetical protein [Actinoplanes xinjiangensis]
MMPATDIDQIPDVIASITDGLDKNTKVAFVLGINTTSETPDQNFHDTIAEATGIIQNLDVPIAINGYAVGTKNDRFPYGRTRNQVMRDPDTTAAIQGLAADNTYPYLSIQDFDTGARTLTNGTHVFDHLNTTTRRDTDSPTRPLMISGGYRVGDPHNLVERTRERLEKRVLDHETKIAELEAQDDPESRKELTVERQKLRGVEKGIEKLATDAGREQFVRDFTTAVDEDMRSRDRQAATHPMLPYSPEPNLFIDGLLTLGRPNIRFGDAGAEFLMLSETLHDTYGLELANAHGAATLADLNDDVLTTDVQVDSQNNRHPDRDQAFRTDFVGSATPTDLSRLAADFAAGNFLPQSHAVPTTVNRQLFNTEGTGFKEYKAELRNPRKAPATPFTTPASDSRTWQRSLSERQLKQLGAQPHNRMLRTISQPATEPVGTGPRKKGFAVDPDLDPAKPARTIGVPDSQRLVAAHLVATSNDSGTIQQEFDAAAVMADRGGLSLQPDSLYHAITTVRPGTDPSVLRTDTITAGRDRMPLETAVEMRQSAPYDNAHFVRAVLAPDVPVNNRRAGPLDAAEIARIAAAHDVVELAAATGTKVQLTIHDDSGNPPRTYPVKGARPLGSLELERTIDAQGRVSYSPVSPVPSPGPGRDLPDGAADRDPGRYRFAPDPATETPAEVSPRRVGAGLLLAGPDDTATPTIAAKFPAAADRFHVFAHADSTSLHVGAERVSPEQLAAMIRANPDWRGQPVVLVACDTGADARDGFAARLARQLPGTRIVAPRGTAFAGAGGHVVVSDPDTYDEFGLPAPGAVTADSRWLSLVAGTGPDTGVTVTELGQVLSPATPIGEPDPDGLTAVIDEYAALTVADLDELSPDAQRIVDRIGPVLPLTENARQWHGEATEIAASAETMLSDIGTAITGIDRPGNARRDRTVQRFLTEARHERDVVGGFRDSAVQARTMTARTLGVLESLGEVSRRFSHLLTQSRRYAAQAAEAARTAQQARRELASTAADQTQQRALLHLTMAEAFARSNFAAASARQARDEAVALAVQFRHGPLAGAADTIADQLGDTRAVVTGTVERESAAIGAYERAVHRIEDAADRLADLDARPPAPAPQPETAPELETAPESTPAPAVTPQKDTSLPTPAGIREKLPQYLLDSSTLGIAEQLRATENLALDAALRTLGARLPDDVIRDVQNDAVDDVDQFLGEGRPYPVTVDGRPAELRVTAVLDFDAMSVDRLRDKPGKLSSKVQETVTHTLKHNRDRRLEPKAIVSAAPGLVIGVGGAVPLAPSVDHSTAHKSKYTSTTTVKVADLAEVEVPVRFVARLSVPGQPVSDPVEATGTVALGVPSALTNPPPDGLPDHTATLSAPVPAQFGVESVQSRHSLPGETFFDQVEALLIADGMGDLVRIGAPGRPAIQQLFSAAGFSGNLPKMVVTDPDDRHGGWVRSGALPRAAEKGWRRYFPGRSQQIEVRLVARSLDEVQDTDDASHTDTSALSGESTDTNAAKRLWNLWGSVGGGVDLPPLSLVIAPRLAGTQERGFTQSIVQQTGAKQTLTATAPGVRYRGRYGVQVRVLGRRPTMLSGVVETFQWTTRDRLRDTALDPDVRRRAEAWHGRTGENRTHYAPARIERGESFGGAFITRLGDGGLYDAVVDAVRSQPGTGGFRLPSPDELLRHFDDPEFARGLSPEVQTALARDAETRTQLSPDQLRHLANRIVGPGLKIPLIRTGTFVDHTTVVTIQGQLTSLSDGDVIDRGTAGMSDKKRSRSTVTGAVDTSRSVELSLEARVLGPLGRAASTLLGGPRAGVSWGDTDEHGLTGGYATESGHGPALDDKGKPTGIQLREFAGSLDITVTTHTFARANQTGRLLSVGSYGRGVPTTIGSMRQAPRTRRLDVRMLVPESQVSRRPPEARPASAWREAERIEHPLPIGLLTGGYPHRLDNRRVVSFLGADHLQDAVIEALAEASEDPIYTFEDGRISTVIADELSPERLTGDAELFSRPLTLSNLWHGRRAEDAGAEVRIRLTPTRPTVLDETEFARIKRTFASGSSSKSRHGRSIELSASLSGTAVARGGPLNHGGSTGTPGAVVTLAVTPWRRVWGTVREHSLAGVSKLRVTGRPERELLVQVDVDAEIVVEARHDSNMPLRLWPASPTRRAGRRVTLTRSAIIPMTTAELTALQDHDRLRDQRISDVRRQLQHAERAEAQRAEHHEQRTRLSEAQTRERRNLLRRQRAEANDATGHPGTTDLPARHRQELTRQAAEHTEATQRLYEAQARERDVLATHQQGERDLVRQAREQQQQVSEAAAADAPAEAVQPEFRPGPQRSLGIGGVVTPVDLSGRIPRLRRRLAEASSEDLATALFPVELGRSAYDNVRGLTAGSFIGAANLHLGSALNGGRTQTVRMERRFRGATYRVTLTAEPVHEPRFTGITLVDELSITDRTTIGESDTASGSRTVGSVTVGVRAQGTETDRVDGDAANTTGHGPTSVTVGGGLTGTANLDERATKQTRGHERTVEQSLTVTGPVPTYQGGMRFTLTVEGPGLPPEGVSVQDVHEVTSLSASEGRPLAVSDPVTSIPLTQTSDPARRMWREAHGFDRLPEPGRFAVEDVLVNLPDLHEAAAQALAASGVRVNDEIRAAIRNGLTVTQAKALPAMQGGVLHLPMAASLGRDLFLDARLVARPKVLRTDADVKIGGTAKRVRDDKFENTAGHSFTLRMTGPMVTAGANHPGGASRVGERETFNAVSGTTFMEQPLYRTDAASVVKDEGKLDTAKATQQPGERTDDDNDLTQVLEYGVEFRFVARSRDRAGRHRAGTEVRVPGGYVIRMDEASATARTGREVPAAVRATAGAVAAAGKTWTEAAARLDAVTSRRETPTEAEQAYREAERAWWEAYRAHEAAVAGPEDPELPAALSIDDVVTVPLINARGELVGHGFPSRDGDTTTMPRFAAAVDDADLGTYRRFEEGPGSGHTDEATPWTGRPVYFDVHGDQRGFTVRLHDGRELSLSGTQFARLAAQTTSLRDARNGPRSPVVLLSCDVAALQEQGGAAFDFREQLRESHLGETYASTTRTYTNPVGQGQVHLAVGDGGRFVRFGDAPRRRVGFAAEAPRTATSADPAEDVWTDRARPSIPPDPRLPIVDNVSIHDVIHDSRRDRYGDTFGLFFPLDVPTDRWMRRAAGYAYADVHHVPNPYYPGTYDRVTVPWVGFTVPPRTVNAVSSGSGFAVIRLHSGRLVQVSGATLARLAVEAGLYDGPGGTDASIVLWGGFQGRDHFPGGLANDFAQYVYEQAGHEAPVFAPDAMTDFTGFAGVVLPQGGSFQRYRPAAFDLEIESVTATSVVSDSPSDDTIVPEVPVEPTPPSRVLSGPAGNPAVFSAVTDPQLSREVTAFAGDLRDPGMRHIVLETSLGGGQVDRQMLGSPWGAEAHREAGRPVTVFLQRSADGTGFSVSSPDGTPRTVRPRDLARHLAGDPGFRSLDASAFNRPLVLVVLGRNGGLTGTEAEQILEGQIETGGYRRIFCPRGADVTVRVGVRPSDGTVLTLSEGAFALVRPPKLHDFEVATMPGDRGIVLPTGQPGDVTAGALLHPGPRGERDFGIAVNGDGTRVWTRPPQGRPVELTGSELGRMLATHPSVERIIATEPDTGLVVLSPRAGRVDLPGNVGRDVADALPIDPEIRAVWAVPGDVRWHAGGRLDVSGDARPVRVAAGRFGNGSGTTDFDSRPSSSAPPPPVSPPTPVGGAPAVVPFGARRLSDRSGTTFGYSAVTAERHAEVTAFADHLRPGGLSSILPAGTPWAADTDRPGARPLAVFVERAPNGRDFLIPGADGTPRRVRPADLMRHLHRETGFPAIDDPEWAAPILLVVLGSPGGVNDREAAEISDGQLEEGYRPIYAPTGDRARITLTSSPGGSPLTVTDGRFTLLAEPGLPDLDMRRLPGGRGLAMPLHRHPGDLVPPAMVSGSGRGRAPFVVAVNGDGDRVWAMTFGNRKLELTGAALGRVVARHPALRQALADDPGLRVLLASPDSAQAGLGRDFSLGLGLDPARNQVLGLPGPVVWNEHGHLEDDTDLAPVPVDGSTPAPVPAPAPEPAEPDTTPGEILPPVELRDSTGRVFGVSYARDSGPVTAWAGSKPLESHGTVDTYEGTAGRGTPERGAAGWAPSRGRKPFVVHFDRSDGVEASVPTAGGGRRALRGEDVIKLVNGTGLLDVRGAAPATSLVLLSAFPGSHTEPGNLGYDLMAAAQRVYDYRGDLYAPQTAPSFTGGRLALDFGGDFAHFFAAPPGFSPDSAATDEAPEAEPESRPRADQEADLRAGLEILDEERRYDPPLYTPADFQHPLQGRPPAPPSSSMVEARPVLDPLGEVFGISLLTRAEDRDKLRLFAQDTSYYALDTVRAADNSKDKAVLAPWARDSPREGNRPLFVFVRNGYLSQDFQIPRRDGTDDLVAPRDLARELARDPDWQKVDAGPFNRPIVLVLVGALGAPSPRQVAEEFLDGMIAVSGYRKVYYPTGTAYLPKNHSASHLYLESGEYRMARGPRPEDLTVETLPGGRGIVLPLPGDPADVAPAVRSASASAQGGAFLVGVAGDGHRVWAATGNGQRRVELDGDAFAEAVAGHPALSQALSRPPSGGIRLVSPLAGARNERRYTGYDFAIGLKAPGGPVTVTATSGVLPASGPAPRVAEVRFEEVRSIPLVSGQSYTGPVGAFFPTPDEYHIILPTETDKWLANVSDYSMEVWANEAGFASPDKTPWGNALPAVVRFGSGDDQTILVRDEDGLGRTITVAAADAGRLALASQAFLDAAAEDNGHLITSASATGANLRQVLVLLPAGFSETSANQVADSVRDDLRRHGLYRTVHTVVGSRMTEWGRLTPPSWIRTDQPAPLMPRDVEMRPLYYADGQLAGVSLPATLDDPALDRQFVYNTRPGGPLTYTSYIGKSSVGAPEYDLRRKDEKWDALILTHGMKAAFWIQMRNGRKPDRFGVNGDVLADLLNNGRYLARFSPDKFRGYLGVVCHIGNQPWPDGPASAFGRRLHELGDKRSITAGSDTVSMGFVHGTLGVYRDGRYSAFPPAGVVHPTDPAQPGILPVLPPMKRLGPAPENQNEQMPGVRWRDGLTLADLRVIEYLDDAGRVNALGFPIGDDMAQRFRTLSEGASAPAYRSFPGRFDEGSPVVRPVPWAGQQPHFSLFVPPLRTGAGVRVLHRRDGIIEIPRAQLGAVLVKGGLFRMPGVNAYTPFVVWTSLAGADPDSGPIQEIGDALREGGHRGQVFGPGTALKMSGTGAALSDGGRMRAYGRPPGDEAVPGPEAVMMPPVETAGDDTEEQDYPWRADAAYRPTPVHTPETSDDETASDDESDDASAAGLTYPDEPPAQSINYNPPPRPATPADDSEPESEDEADQSEPEDSDEDDSEEDAASSAGEPAAPPVFPDEPPAQSINYNPVPQPAPPADDEIIVEVEDSDDETGDEEAPSVASEPAPVAPPAPRHQVVRVVDRHGRAYGFGMPYGDRDAAQIGDEVGKIDSERLQTYARLDRRGQMTTSRVVPWAGRNTTRPFWVDTRNMLRDSDPDMDVVANSASGAQVADLLVNTVPELAADYRRKPIVLLVGNAGHGDDDPGAPARRFIRRLRELGHLGTVYGPTGDLRFKPSSRHPENWLRIQDGKFVRLAKEPEPPRGTRR